MAAAYKACIEAGVEVPNEIYDFFDGDPPQGPDYLMVAIDLRHSDCCHPYNAEMRDGYEVHVDMIPKDIKVLRFFNSY